MLFGNSLGLAEKEESNIKNLKKQDRRFRFLAASSVYRRRKERRKEGRKEKEKRKEGKEKKENEERRERERKKERKERKRN
uniref:Uncharacterized protein n=1 Tax=Macaca fascicularis TaxID=9541 RepID=Q9GMM9_MACFA|nr:hypothetical protein [Macaca fascicularis]